MNRDGFRGAQGGWHMPPFFAITCFFCNNFEELQTVFFEVELITNNATINICLSKYYQNTPSFVIWQTIIIFF